jgi:hypothetical protein
MSEPIKFTKTEGDYDAETCEYCKEPLAFGSKFIQTDYAYYHPACHEAAERYDAEYAKYEADLYKRDLKLMERG